MMSVLIMIPRDIVCLYILIIFMFPYIHEICISNSRQIKMQLISRQWIREIVVHHCLSLLLEHIMHIVITNDI